MPAILMQTMLMMALRGSGDSLTPLIFMALAVLLDIGLNPVFILGLGPIPAMGIGGSARAMPKGSKLVFPRKVVLVVGPPIPPPAQVNGRVPRRAVREHTEQLRERIQGLFDQARIRAGD